MAYTRKSWREKLADAKGLPKICTLEPGKRLKGIKPGDTMVIPAPHEVDALMKQVPKGKVVTVNELRAALARKHKTTIACPLVTGIFAWIAAHAAEEAREAGVKTITPYWRTLKTKGEINAKYPGGANRVATLLKKEGHQVIKKGERQFVSDFWANLAKI